MTERSLDRTTPRVDRTIFSRALHRLTHRGPPRHGRERTADTDYSMVVPFRQVSAPTSPRPPVAVVCHIFHADLSGSFLDIVSRLGLAADIFVSTDTAEKKAVIAEALSPYGGGRVDIRIVENRGRDIGPKLIAFGDVYAQYERILFLHSKKSFHYDFGESWREYLIDCLAGSPRVAESIMEIFDSCPQVGMVVPQHYSKLRAVCRINWGLNFKTCQSLARDMGFSISKKDYVDIPSGSMFWARSSALKPLLDLQLGWDDFPIENGQQDGTIAHAIERLFLFACERAGFDWVKIIAESDRSGTAVPIEDRSQIADFVKQHKFSLLSPRKMFELNR